MVKQQVLTSFIYNTLGYDLLDKSARVDTVPNSVQIYGIEKVTKVALGVSCSLEFLQKAIDWGSEYVVVHHGLHTSGYLMNGRFDAFQDRLKLIFSHNLTLAGFHYALDAHPVIGNNAQIIKALGATQQQEYFDGWGYVGQFNSPVSPEALKSKLRSLTKHDIYQVGAGPEKITRIGVCSGGAKPYGSQVMEIIDKKIDAHITGEITEGSPPIAQEARYHYFACGHYATETFGVKALGKLIQQQFKRHLEVKFLDIPSIL